LLKKCAAQTNAHLKELDQDKAALIVRAADEVIAGTLDSEFPLCHREEERCRNNDLP